MTTTYKTNEFETAVALREAINSDLAQLAYPFTVKHKVYGEGQLTFVKAPLIGPALYATIEFPAGIKTISLDVVMAYQLLELPESLKDVLLEAQSVFKADFEERTAEQRRATILSYEQALAEKKKAEREKAAKEKKNK